MNEKMNILEYIIEYAMFYPSISDYTGDYNPKVIVLDYERVNNGIRVKVLYNNKEVNLNLYLDDINKTKQHLTITPTNYIFNNTDK